MLAANGRFDCLKSQSTLSLENPELSTFHLIAFCLFIGAILHTFLVSKIHELARSLEHKNHPRLNKPRPFWIQVLYFLAEVEVVFAIWAIPLFFTIVSMFGWQVAIDYINTRDYTEAKFVVVILCIASTKPILWLAKQTIHFLAQGIGGRLSSWWFVLLTLGPILGSFITEPAAMVIAAMLLSKQFYEYRPSSKLAYATLALLFTNISVGGALTNFASPAVLILSHAWDWSNGDMLSIFGWKALLGILLANGLYLFYFRKEFIELNKRKKIALETFNPEKKEPKIPWWVIATHVLFLTLIVLTSNYPAIFIAIFLLFLGFHRATRNHQDSLKISRPLLVGLFIAGLIIHSGLQGWWVIRAFSGLSPIQVLGMAMSLTAFNDNAAIACLASLIPDWSHIFQYALVTGVIAGGGLTVIANAPNPAGYVILNDHFGEGISSWKLLIAALIPAFIFYVIFTLFSPLFSHLIHFY